MNEYLAFAQRLPPDALAEVMTFHLTKAGAMVLGLDDRTLYPTVVPAPSKNRRRLAFTAPLRDVLVILDDLQRRGDPDSGFDQPKNWCAIARANESLLRRHELISRIVGDVVEGLPPDAEEHAQRDAAWSGLQA